MNDQLTEKIRKLLAMADHPNSNQNEASIALEKAQELLLRHNLTRADVIADDSDNTPAGMGKLSKVEGSGYSWKRSLISVLASANLCKVIGTPHMKQWHIFGSYSNVLAVMEMYTWITHQLVFMCEREFRAYKNDEGTERGQTWKLGYYQGAIMAIKERLDKPLQAFTYGTGKDLVLRNSMELSEAVKKVFPRLVTHYSQGARSNDGRSAGTSAGRSMDLAPKRRLGGNLRLASGH